MLCVDEKPSIQALERAQGYLRLPNGRALSGHSHDYRRHGTTTLFAALDLATGKIAAAHKKRRRRDEFLAFMDDIVAHYRDKEIHAVLDNLNTHKKNDDWPKAHPNVHFHFTPTRASWLNQVEIWFSILAGKSLCGASFTSVDQLRQHIDDFIARCNADATPFAWTKAAVHQKALQRPPHQPTVIPGISLAVRFRHLPPMAEWSVQVSESQRLRRSRRWQDGSPRKDAAMKILVTFATIGALIAAPAAMADQQAANDACIDRLRTVGGPDGASGEVIDIVGGGRQSDHSSLRRRHGVGNVSPLMMAP